MKIKDATTSSEKLAMQFHKIANLTHRLHRVDRHNATEEKADKVSIHRGQGLVLTVLSEEGPMSIGQIVKSLDIRPSSAGELVDKLVQNGFVTRADDEGDRRVSIISITDAGKACLESTAEVNAAYFDDLFSGLDADELEQLSGLLDKLVTSLKAKGEDVGIELGDSSRRRKTRHSNRHVK